MRNLLVFGASGHGKVVADIARSTGVSVACFVDEDADKDGSLFCGVPVICSRRLLRDLSRWRESAIAVAIGDNKARQRCFELIHEAKMEIATLVHATAVVARSARLGAGTVVMAGAVVNPDATVGEGAILNTGSVVEHDNELESFVHLSPTAALGGNVAIGARTHVGLGAVVLPGLRIGRDVRIGAGAAVVDDIGDGLTVVGVPARPIGERRTTESPEPVGSDRGR